MYDNILRMFETRKIKSIKKKKINKGSYSNTFLKKMDKRSFLKASL